MVRVVEESTSVLPDYGDVPIAFTVRSKYVPTLIEGRTDEWEMIEASVTPPWIKDYDAGEPPTRWLRWDTSKWRVFSAFCGAKRIGGAVVAFDTLGADFLEGRTDIAALWDIRVVPEWRGKGVGSILFEHTVCYARRLGCVELKIETQDINVPACDFYAKQGCRLSDVTPNAYSGWPDEIRLTWRFDL